MATYKVKGTISYSFIGTVEAKSADEAESIAEEKALDGDFLSNYFPDEVEVWDVTETERDTLLTRPAGEEPR